MSEGTETARNVSRFALAQPLLFSVVAIVFAICGTFLWIRSSEAVTVPQMETYVEKRIDERPPHPTAVTHTEFDQVIRRLDQLAAGQAKQAERTDRVLERLPK